MATPRGQKTAAEIIAEECDASVHREFPAQWLDKTLDEITQAAKRGTIAARKAYKLLQRPKYKKK
jgi:hypothetical protein